MSSHIASVVSLRNAITSNRTSDDVVRCFEESSALLDAEDPTATHPIARAAQFLRIALADQIYFAVDHLFESIAFSIAKSPKEGAKIGSLNSALKPVFDLAALSQMRRERAETTEIEPKIRGDRVAYLDFANDTINPGGCVDDPHSTQSLVTTSLTTGGRVLVRAAPGITWLGRDRVWFPWGTNTAYQLLPP